MADLTITQYKPEYLAIWDQFIDESLNGTIFHRQKFLGYHPPDRFEDHSLLFYEKNKLVSVFPAAIIEKEGKKVLKSHPGTSYGGPVFNQKIPLRKVYRVLALLDAHCKEKAIERIEFRLAPKIFNACFLDQLDFSLTKHDYKRFEQELATYYSLEDFNHADSLEAFIDQFPTTSKKELKKGLKASLNCKVLNNPEEVEKFYRILEENLRSRYEKNPTHSFEELRHLLNLFPNKIFIYGVFKEDVLIGGYLVLEINDQGWHIFYACQNFDYQQTRPLNFALGGLLKLAKESDVPVLNYGISTEDGGEYINWGLFRFKEDFGGTGILRNYWMKALK